MTQAVILAGGKGTRLASRLNGRPKPLIEIDGVPLLKRQIDLLHANGVDDIVLLVNHAANQIEAFVRNEYPTANIRLIDDGEPRGTAGATLACLDQLQDRFLVVYGDTLFDIDVSHLLDAHEQSGAEATLLLHPNDHPFDSDLVEIDAQGWIKRFHPYPHDDAVYLRNLVNAAFYAVERSALEAWVERMPTGDFAKDLFPRMVEAGSRLLGYRSFEYIKDVGTPARVDRAEGHLRSGLVARSRRTAKQAAVFVDRDGTLNELNGFIRSAEQFTLIDGVGAAIKRLNAAEYRVIVVTNQPVIARGEATLDDLDGIHAKLEGLLGAEGAMIDGIYFCPHHPHRGYEGEVTELKIECACRKPGIGMIQAAAAEFNIDLQRSWVIGDSTADIAMAATAGVRSILVATGEGGADGKYLATPDFSANNFPEAVDILLAQPVRSVIHQEGIEG